MAFSGDGVGRPAADLLYIADIRAFDGRDESIQSYITDSFSKERLEKLSFYTQAADRARSLVAGLLLERVFGARASEVKTGVNGKPYIQGERHFNISHSGDYVLLALSDKPVGVDIELRRDDDYIRLAEECFHPHELLILKGADEASIKNLFYDIWTMKESYMKMTGMGFTLAPKSFCIDTGKGFRTEWGIPSIRLYNRLEDYSIALCSSSHRLPDEITPIDIP